ncbi:hypothetical protein RM531_11000 [Salinisphaera sp. P385]|uniref:Secreted protein n=1 Tax=Spectribacter acetivorans TaxID=3075603 RepID=A0ABU3B9U1_9GAMM|nr:hypothetical protein [Salinisphaera sp. P385]MDT0619004.1 hypothetical protein [Salinisphaera sp. P385]
MHRRSGISVAAGALVLMMSGPVAAQLPLGDGLTGGGTGLSVVDTSALGATLLQAGSDGAVAATAGTPLASLGVATSDTVSGAAPLVTLPLAYADFVFFDGPVPLPRVLPDSPVALLAPLLDELGGGDGSALPGLADLPQVNIVPRLDPLPVPIPQLGQGLDL